MGGWDSLVVCLGNIQVRCQCDSEAVTECNLFVAHLVTLRKGLMPVIAFSRTTGPCGGIDFWGNCWEWTNTQISDCTYLIKGGAWDTRRDECLSEYSEASRDPSRGFDNVVFRVVMVADAGRTGTEARIWRGEEGENEGDEIMIKRPPSL